MQTLSPYHIEQTDLHELYQALYFLHNVAATKLVDGAWLYGLISRWHEPSCTIWFAPTWKSWVMASRSTTMYLSTDN